MKPGNTGITRIFKAAGYSWLGLKAAFVNEAAFRQELFLCIVLAPVGFWLGESNNSDDYVMGRRRLLNQRR